MLLCEEVQCIESFSLRFCDCWNIRGARKSPVASERSTGILNDDSLRFGARLGLVVKKWPQSVLIALAAETIWTLALLLVCMHWTHFSGAHGSARVRMRSGRVSASSLYTFQLLDSLLSPPSAAGSRHSKAIISPASVWKTCFSVV